MKGAWLNPGGATDRNAGALIVELVAADPEPKSLFDSGALPDN